MVLISGYLEKAYVFDLFDMPYTLYDLGYVPDENYYQPNVSL